MGNVRERLKLVALSGEEYHAAIKQASEAGVIDSTIYDALIAHCARKAKAATLYTWNTRHFKQFGPAIANRLKTP